MNEEKNVNTAPRAPRPAARPAAPKAQPQVAAQQATRPAATQQSAQQATRPAAKQQSAQQTTRPAATQQSAQQATRPAAKQQSAQQATRPAVKQQSAQQATRPAVKQQSAQQATRPAAKQQSAQQATRPAATQQSAQQTTRPAATQQSAQQAARPAAKQQSAQQATRPAAKQQSAQQATRPAAKQQSAQQAKVDTAPQPRLIHRPEPERITSPEKQRRRETVNSCMYENLDKNASKVKKTIKPLKVVARVLSFVLTFVIILAATLFICLKMICGETSPAAKELLVTTLLETGQMKDVASWFLSAEEIQQIVDDNTMSSFENDIDSSLISIDKTPDSNGGGEEQKDIEVVEISGRTFFGTLLIVKDPSRIELSSIYPWAAEGVPLDELVTDAGAVAGINGGLYNSSNNSGGRPYGVVVCKGEIQLNEPNQFPGLVLIGFTEDDILEIIPIDGYSKQGIIDLVAEKKIRDAVTFQEEASDKNNHFVQLVINGEARDMNGMGSGLNPRTAIGQRADGSVLMLVTDGRGKSGHLGASASDLINVMVEYGAVNAANLDGGSSSCMYYEGEYLMTSVTFYYSNSSWKLPLAFVVK